MFRWQGCALAALVFTSSFAEAATFSVTTTNSSGPGSLGAAILAANATPASDTIEFHISGSGVKTIAGGLPAITEPLTIDGFTQAGASANTQTGRSLDAVLRIRLDGSGLAAGVPVLQVDSDQVVLRGLVLSNIESKRVGILVSAGAVASIHGCFIGTNATGTLDQSGGTGVLVNGTAEIGGKPANTRNLISGNNVGVQLSGSSSVVGFNLFGTTAAGDPTLGNATGVLVSGPAASGNFIGSEDGAFGNVIDASAGDGIRILAAVTGNNRIAGNSFDGNGGLAIDLGADGVTPNDPGDSDAGPNGLQNTPVLHFARRNGGSVTVDGFLEGPPGDYRLEVYVSGEADPSGFGEGQFLALAGTVTILAGEDHQAFRKQVTPPVFLDPLVVTATVENLATHATSEFSNAVTAAEGGTEIVVTNTNDSGTGSLRAALASAKTTAGPNTIVFAIPGKDVAVIPLQASLTIDSPVVLDGYSLPGAQPNRQVHGTGAVMGVVLDGGAFAFQGNPDLFLATAAAGSTLRGVAVVKAGGAGILLAADHVTIEGCHVGTGLGAEGVSGNGDHGIVSSGDFLRIGGFAPGQRNVIAGNAGAGIVSAGDHVDILGNILGSDRTEGPGFGNGSDGIRIAGSDVRIGGDTFGAGNLVRSNGDDGIDVSDGSTGVTIAGNRVFDDGGIGIDLGPSGGVTANDADDADSGANGLQNFPLITSASVDSAGISVKGTLDLPAAAAAAPYTIRVFASAACDASGNGEGETFVGARTVQLSGNAETWSLLLPGTLAEGAVLTATATDEALGQTSEFSACFDTNAPATLCGDASFNGSISASDALLVLKTAVGSVSCDLCVCDANGSGSVTATDALLVLRLAVGQGVTTTCPACS